VELSKRDSLREMALIREEIDRLFDSFFGKRPKLMGAEESEWTPVVDVEETPDEFVVIAEIPGVRKEDVNILVTDDGQPHVVDFGLAKTLHDDGLREEISRDGELAGTPAYMSPEQAAGHPDRVDMRTDVYSLGVILYRLLTGRLPRDMSGLSHDVVRRIAENELVRPRHRTRKIDRELEAILLKALARDPERRYSMAGGLADDLDNYLKGEPLAARRPAIGYFLFMRLRKYRAAVAELEMGAPKPERKAVLEATTTTWERATTLAREEAVTDLVTCPECGHSFTMEE